MKGMEEIEVLFCLGRRKPHCHISLQEGTELWLFTGRRWAILFQMLKERKMVKVEEGFGFDLRKHDSVHKYDYNFP